MKKFIKNSLSNPKVRLALCVLLSVILAIGFFGDSNSAAASSKFLLATLSPMAMGFTLIPFILSVLGIGISGYQTYKQRKKEKEGKITNTYNNIKKEKEELNKEYNKLKKEIEKKISGPEEGITYLQEVNNFIINKGIKLEDLSEALGQDGSRLPYTSIITFFLINNEVDRLREIKAEIAALNVIEGKDLKTTKLKEISKDMSKVFPDPRAKNAVITKLMVGEKGKGR